MRRLLLGLILAGLVFAVSGCGGCTCYSYDPVNSTVYPGLPTTSTTAKAASLTTTATAPPTSATSTTAASIVIQIPTTASTFAQTTLSFPDTTTTSERLSSAETRLGNGRVKAMGYIHTVWEAGGKRYISIDYVEYFTGAAADKAAIADGKLQPGQTLPKGYYIRNTSTTMRQFQVSTKALITTNTWQYTDRGVTWTQFKSFWSSPPTGAERLSRHPWWIEREGGTVMTIEEPYLL